MHSKPFMAVVAITLIVFLRLPPGQASRPHEVVLAAQAVGLEGDAASQQVFEPTRDLALKIHDDDEVHQFGCSSACYLIMRSVIQPSVKDNLRRECHIPRLSVLVDSMNVFMRFRTWYLSVRKFVHSCMGRPNAIS